jgi:AbrB family looped-hinge helix DNA binding protein
MKRIVIDIDKKNGDAIIELPPELLEEMGWKEGDTLDISEKDGRVIIKKIDELEAHKAEQ